MNTKERVLLANWIMCPDGTMLPSFHVHDFRSHENYSDKDSLSFVDGGREYLRRGGDFIEMSVYSDDPFEVIRRFVCRGSRGKDGKQPLKWIPLFRMEDDHLKQLIADFKRGGNWTIRTFRDLYKKELEYREINNIKI